MSRIQALQSLALVAFLTLAASGTGDAAEAGELVRSSPAIQKSRAAPVSQPARQKMQSRQDEPAAKPSRGGLVAVKRHGNDSAPATRVVGQGGFGSALDSFYDQASTSGDPSGADVEYCSADEFGTLCCKIVQPGGDLNPHVHVKNVTGTNLPAGQDIVAFTLAGPVTFKLTHPLAQGQWTAGPSVAWNQVYSEQFEKAYCYAGTQIQ